GSRASADAVGDAGAGFDITRFTVRNDDAGRISFRVDMPAVATLPENLGLLLLLDTDLRREAEPIDHVITFTKGTAVVAAVSGSAGGSPYIPRSLKAAFTPGAVTISVHRDDLGGTRAMLAGAASFTISPAGEPNLETDTDAVPESDLLPFALKLPTRLLVRSSNLSPARPAAGGTFRAALFVRDVTFGAPGEPASGGRVTCAFSAGGRKVTARGSLNAAGRASCAGTVPAGATGRLTGTITYAQNGARVTRTFAGSLR
ncbi:MAG TPA: hypothetical protein VL422_13960, partial [Miltoncostaea sp.]|nr:hypothetical protein [Miltoncostaea sp.]